ncbi:exosortase [Erythrobacteraceae bacterium CFH 75059]|uniref:exosortase V n=1 Tax=Qipengyuania thermophila TaxID=2509361 RepID=UPI001020A4CB|nr:exosortase V [Qipengyuania thermophila]TCD04862.1 exosortase [Erythrobacteraceae bacterium CFH 75059]
MATLIADTQEARPRARLGRVLTADRLVLLLALVAFVVPTMMFVAQNGWTGEEGAHGPIILATGLWLLWREWTEVRHLARPGRAAVVALGLAVLVPLFVLTRVTQIVELEGYVMYAVLVTVLYSLVGERVIRALWFPLLYLAFAFPPPETLIAALTVPLKMALSEWSIALLRLFGYPIGGEGVRIFIGQYELLVAAACSGLNSLISLTAITLFYVYLRHQAEWRYALFLVLLVIPVALLANFARVLILILLTYHAGEATAQGFLHNFAGLFMFAIALGIMFALDELLRPLWYRYQQRRSPGLSGTAADREHLS